MKKELSHGPVYDDYESDPWESQEEEPEEQQKGQFISCPEPVSEQPSSEDSQPVSSSHPPMPTNDIQPCMSSCGAEQAFCYKFHKIFHSFYEPVNEYMEWHFLHILEPALFYLNFSPWRKDEGCNRSAVTVASSASDH
jgi:hypothetical protein